MRREIDREARQRILELSPHVFRFHSAHHAAIRPNVQGYEFFPDGSFNGVRNVRLGP